jgi:iron complex outermembrane recepter protein
VRPGEITVTLKTPDGSTQTVTDPDGDLILSPKAGPGSYEVTISFGGQSETTTVEVPSRGQIRVIFNPDVAPRIQTFVAAIEELTVTAQRVEENLQKIPVAVTALTARDLEVRNVQNVQGMAAETPNLYMDINTGTSSGSRAALRGVGEDESFFTSDPPVGIYIDDIYIPRQTGAMFDLYDLERLEVLRGPQGTLYGRNTTAGAIRFVTRQPGNQLRARVEGTVGEFERTDFRGSLSVPLGQRAGFEAATMIRKHDGYDENLVNGAKVNDQDIWGVRGSLRLLPSDTVNILVTGDYLRERSTPGYAVGFVPQPPVIGGFGVGAIDFDQQLDGDTDVHTLQSDLLDPLNDLDQKGVAATITWNASDRLAFKSITGYREMDNLLLLDADGRVGNFLPAVFGPGPTFHLFQDQAQKQFSQELHVQGRPSGRASYIAGLYFFHEENQQRTENVIFSPLGRNNFWDTGLDTDSYAVFGSATIRASDRLTLTAGARYTSDNKVFDTIVYRASGQFPQVASQQLIACVAPDGRVVGSTRPCDATDPPGSVDTPVEKHLDETWDAVTPRFALDFQATRELLVYASASRGFKSGAFDGRSNNGATVLPLGPVQPETLWAYEVGFKSDWDENRFRLNGTAFLTEWNDLQGTGTDPSGNFKRFSLGDVETKGVELESRWVPVSGLELSGQLGVLDTRFKTVNFNQQVDCASLGTGDAELELKYSPHDSYRLGGLYTTQGVLAGGRFTLGGSVSHKSKYFQQTCNAAATTEDGYTLVDASLAYETRDGRFRIALLGENLTDERYIQGVFAIAGLRMLSAYINPPRRFSVSVRYAFN